HDVKRGGPLPCLGHVYAKTGGPLVERVWQTFNGCGIQTVCIAWTVLAPPMDSGRVPMRTRDGVSVSQAAMASKLRSPYKTAVVVSAAASRWAKTMITSAVAASTAGVV